MTSSTSSNLPTPPLVPTTRGWPLLAMNLKTGAIQRSSRAFFSSFLVQNKRLQTSKQADKPTSLSRLVYSRKPGMRPK